MLPRLHAADRVRWSAARTEKTKKSAETKGELHHDAK